MTNPEQPSTEKLTTEELLEGFRAITRMPDTTAAEARAKRDAYNDAIRVLDERIPMIHNESGNNSLDDEGQEEVEDDRERNLIALTLREFRAGLSHMHDRIVELEGRS